MSIKICYWKKKQGLFLEGQRQKKQSKLGPDKFSRVGLSAMKS